MSASGYENLAMDGKVVLVTGGAKGMGRHMAGLWPSAARG
jgi:NAD(P)-dependent dehydrogenase (short-subunit alcohol dehydrogenase family)